jgi:hypothetical protein
MKKQSKDRKSIVHLKVSELKELIYNSVKSNENQKSEIDFEETLSKLNDSIIELSEDDLRNLIIEAISQSSFEKGETTIIPQDFHLISREEMAKKLKISLPTLRKWTIKKIIPNHIKLGGYVYYNEQQVFEFLKSKK